MNNYKYMFVIPTYNTSEAILKLIKEIQQKSHYHIVVIEDGKNKNDKQYIFDEIKSMENTTLLHHYINLGKGAALKACFNHILVNYPEIKGVVTLDDDGQHCVSDALKILDSIKEKNNIFVLGYRLFSKNIPLKSYIGNNISKFIYRIVLGRKFKDTQTGLRGLSKNFMLQSLNIKANRYEFETEQLALSTQQDKKFEISEIPIKTIYIDNNKASSFRPLIDSLKIYFVLFRYALSSIITFVVDIIIFSLTLGMLNSVLISNLMARVVTTVVQFYLIKNFVFNTKSGLKTFILFVIYVLTMGVLSSSLQVAIDDYSNIGKMPSKLIIEIFLFFVNFAFLRSFLFKK